MSIVIGILGAAGIAPAALLRPALRRNDVVVAAVASRRGAREYADRLGIERAYASYQELLADPDLDLAYNALPPSLHARWSIAALEAGKHVLCEKPFAMNAAEAERVVEVAERSGRRAIEA
ncbi:MAG TPA: Gfo/Idh/MocA family oxidoreductase, partial [Propionibacteriaceae bacterium]|nr:Gfo/Idh/MocA family oxidoreductase [Propionibacteriaceae bacterium]